MRYILTNFHNVSPCSLVGRQIYQHSGATYCFLLRVHDEGIQADPDVKTLLVNNGTYIPDKIKVTRTALLPCILKVVGLVSGNSSLGFP